LRRDPVASEAQAARVRVRGPSSSCRQTDRLELGRAASEEVSRARGSDTAGCSAAEGRDGRGQVEAVLKAKAICQRKPCSSEMDEMRTHDEREIVEVGAGVFAKAELGERALLQDRANG
jgi:hypothetical protein